MTKMSIVTGLTTQPNVNVCINVLKNTHFENIDTRHFPLRQVKLPHPPLQPNTNSA